MTEKSADIMFEEYVSSLIDNNPSIAELGYYLALILDEDQFNKLEPMLLGIARQMNDTLPVIRGKWKN